MKGDEREVGVEPKTYKLSDFWENASQSAPAMGIVNHRRNLQKKYQEVYQIGVDVQGAMKVALSPDEREVIVGGSQSYVVMLSARARCDPQRIEIGCEEVRDLGFINAETIWVLDAGGNIHILRGPVGTKKSVSMCRTRIKSQAMDFRCGYNIKGRRLLLTGGGDGMVWLWNLKTGLRALKLVGHQAPVTAVTLGRFGPISACEGGQIRFWDDRGLQIDQVDISDVVVGLTAHEGLLAWVERSGELCVMKQGDSRPVRLRGHREGGRSVAMRGDGYVASGGTDGWVLVYNGRARMIAQEIQMSAPVDDVSISMRALAVACEGGEVSIFRRR